VCLSFEPVFSCSRNRMTISNPGPKAATPRTGLGEATCYQLNLLPRARPGADGLQARRPSWAHQRPSQQLCGVLEDVRLVAALRHLQPVDLLQRVRNASRTLKSCLDGAQEAAAAEAFSPRLRHGAAAARGSRSSMEDCHVGSDDFALPRAAAAAPAAAVLPTIRAFYAVSNLNIPHCLLAPVTGVLCHWFHVALKQIWS